MASLPLPDGEDTQIEWVQENPKRNGSLSYERYELYKGSKTVQEARENGAIRADFENDYKKGFLKIVKRSGAAVAAEAKAEPNAKPKAAGKQAAAPKPDAKQDAENKKECSKKGEGETGKANEKGASVAEPSKENKGKPNEEADKNAEQDGKAKEDKRKNTVTEKRGESLGKSKAEGRGRRSRATSAAGARVKASFGKAAAAKLPAKVAKRTAARSAAGAEAAGKKKKKKDKKAKKERKDKKDKKGKRDKKDKKEKRARGPEEAAKKAKLADTAHATTDSKGLLVRTHGKHSSRYLGVSLNRSTGKWQATLVQPSGSREDLGQFGTEEEAARVYTNAVRTQEVLLAKPAGAASASQAPAATAPATSAPESGASGSGEWSLAKSISELTRQLDELSQEQKSRVQKFLTNGTEAADVDVRSLDIKKLPVQKLRELTRFIANEYATSAASRMMTGKAPQLVAPQRMPTGAPLPPAAPSRAAAPSRPTARPSAAAPARPAGPTVAPGAAQDSAAPAGKPSQAAAVFRAPAPSAARPQPLVTPSAAALLAGAAEGPPQEAAPAGHGGAHGQAAGAAQPKALAPLRAPRTPPLRRGSSHGEAPGDTAHKAPRTEATPHCAQDGPRDGGYPLSGCGGSSSSTAGPRQLQLALPPPARPWETQVAWDTSAGAFGTAWGTHGAVGPGGAAAAPLARPAPADASSQALVPFNAAWQQQPPGAAPPAELHPRAQPLLGGFGGLPPGPLDPLVWLGEDGGWAPGRAPGADLQAPRYISQGTCNPPGPCREGCRCNQVASNPRDLEKPWLEDKVRSAAVQAAIQCFERHPGVLRRGRVSHQNRFQPAPVGVYDQRYDPPPLTVPEPPMEAPAERSPPTGPVPQ